MNEVILLTNKKRLLPEEFKALEELDIEIRFYPNRGYDFGMYYRALETLDLQKYDRLILTNDSCMLVNQLTPFFDWFKAGNLSMAGLLDSYQFIYHLQSYFLAFKGSGIDKLGEYFAANKIKSKKDDVIQTYEIGLTSWFSSIGLEIGSFYNSREFSKNPQLNPAIFQIKELLNAGFPLIKRMLLKGGYTKSDLLYFAINGLVINPNELKEKIIQINPDLDPYFLDD